MLKTLLRENEILHNNQEKLENRQSRMEELVDETHSAILELKKVFLPFEGVLTQTPMATISTPMAPIAHNSLRSSALKPAKKIHDLQPTTRQETQSDWQQLSTLCSIQPSSDMIGMQQLEGNIGNEGRQDYSDTLRQLELTEETGGIFRVAEAPIACNTPAENTSAESSTGSVGYTKKQCVMDKIAVHGHREESGPSRIRWSAGDVKKCAGVNAPVPASSHSNPVGCDNAKSIAEIMCKASNLNRCNREGNTTEISAVLVAESAGAATNLLDNFKGQVQVAGDNRPGQPILKMSRRSANQSIACSLAGRLPDNDDSESLHLSSLQDSHGVVHEQKCEPVQTDPDMVGLQFESMCGGDASRHRTATANSHISESLLASNVNAFQVGTTMACSCIQPESEMILNPSAAGILRKWEDSLRGVDTYCRAVALLAEIEIEGPEGCLAQKGRTCAQQNTSSSRVMDT